MAGNETAAREWQASYGRFVGLIGDADPAQLAGRVPACPDWTVRDLLAHVVGVDADVLAGTEAADHNPEWTQAQVVGRRTRSVEEVLAEWAALAPDLVRYITEIDPRPLGDLIIHEQDLRGALGVPGARDTAGLAAIRTAMAGRLGGAVQKAGLAPIRLESDGPDGWTWSSGEGEPGLVLRASAYDLTRALTSRRTADQLRSWVIRGDVEPYLAVFTLSPLPVDDLGE